LSALNQDDLADKPATIPTLMFKLLMAVAFAVALLAMVQMPPGMPVATVAVGGAENAGLLAAQIVATADAEVAKKLVVEREGRRQKVLESDAEVSAQFGKKKG